MIWFVKIVVPVHVCLEVRNNMKVCTFCKKEKPLDDFSNHKNRYDGKNTACRGCMKEYREKRKPKSSENLLEFEHKVCNGCKLELPFSFFWKSKLGKFGLRSKCKECCNQNNKDYKKDTGWENNRRKVRRKTDVQFWFKNILRGRLYDALQQHTKGYNVTKRHSALILLGCTMAELKCHLESKFRDGMCWENKGLYWEVDHILPCASFDLSDIEQQKICFHYTNLQPLTIFENRSKRDKILTQAA